MSNDQIIAVQCDALSYSGTTWLNLTLGAHDDALTIGPTYRVWDLKDKDFEGACLVHGKTCEFWANFNTYWDRSENFLVALSRYSERTHFLFDNPAPDFIAEVLEDPRVTVKHLRYVRDGRAITASFARKFPDKNYYDTILPSGWFYHSFMAIPAQAETPDKKFVHYENCAKDIEQFTQEVGAYVGLDFQHGGHRFWEADHHITTGNAGPINMVRLHQGLTMPNFESKDVYEAQYAKLVENPDDTFFDERWRSQLTREDLFYFDLIMGEQNEKLGYVRDVFTDEEVMQFWIAYGPSLADGTRQALPDYASFDGQTRFNAAAERIAAKTPVAAPVAEVEAVATPIPVLAPTNFKPLGERALPSLDTNRRTDLEPTVVTEPDANGIRQIWPPFGPKMAQTLEPTTQYYDGVDPDKLAALKPYTVGHGPYDRKTLEELVVNANMHAGYGNDYLDKHELSLTVDPITRYRDLLMDLQKHSNITFKTFRDGLAEKPAADEVCGLLRHDVDGDLMAALDMAKIEHSLGIKSSYYLLHTAPYYGIMQGDVFERNHESLEIYKEIEALGHEIAIHTDTLWLYQEHNTDGAQGLMTEIQWLRDNGLTITGTLAHNSFMVYGANNYSIFEGRPLNTSYYPGPAKAVTHRGKWAPLQILNEAEMGLTHEGNEVFWQTETKVRYYCLMHQAMWIRTDSLHGTLQAPAQRHKGVDSWVSQEELVDDARHIPNGDYAVIVVHPLHYGTRPTKLDSPYKAVARSVTPSGQWLNALTKAQGGAPSTKTVTVKNENGRDSEIYTGMLGDHVEFSSVYVRDELGGFDRPQSRLTDGDIRFVFAGRKNFAAQSLPTDSKLSQMTLSLLKHEHKLHKIQMRAVGFTPEILNAQTFETYLKSLTPSSLPLIAVVGLSQEDLEDTSETSLVEYLNEHAGYGFTVFAVVEQSGVTDTAVNQALIDGLRARARFQIFDPFEQFAHYELNQGTGKIMWESTPEWAYQGHFLAARMLSGGIADFIKMLGERKSGAA